MSDNVKFTSEPEGMGPTGHVVQNLEPFKAKATADTLPEAEAAALAITDPAPAKPVKSSPAPGLRLGAEPEPAPAKPTPDPELAALIATARATCRCTNCVRTVRTNQARNATITSGGQGDSASCGMREILTALIARRPA